MLKVLGDATVLARWSPEEGAWLDEDGHPIPFQKADGWLPA
jgi:hypothetical protein